MELFSLTINTKITDIKWEAYPIGFLLLFLCLFTIIGNILIIYIIINNDILHTSKYYYISSLAFADLLIGLIVMPLAFIFEMTDDEYWLFTKHLRFLCDFWHSMDIFASSASIFGLSVIGLDRYVAITKPIQYKNAFISKRWYYMLIFIWISSAAISFPPVIYFGTEQDISKRTSISNESISTASSLFKECDFPNNPYYMLFVSVVSFYLPLIVMIYVYIKVYLAAKKQLKALRSGYKHQHLGKSSKSFISRETTEKNSSILLKSRRPSFELVTLRIHHGTYQNPSIEILNKNNNKSVIKMQRKNKFWKKLSRDQKARKFVGIVMGVFVICWLPYFIYFILSGVFRIRIQDEQNHELMFKIFSWLGYTNSALDVLVYIFTSKELRATFFKLFSK